ncbi:carbohydrate ABC transporter permease [Vallitalea maricola]|uniref:Sugar ABC transporter permease n=1 Tax=Vallitalea maricola TaxID=3074433 RepID=A0ACB5UKQ7_9FIRM|nr:sugar ABC transporter permease [Vallitalea sp. AN17-2]
MNSKLQKRVLIISFLFIPLILLAMFVLYPTLKLLQLSFTDWNGITKEINYIGFENYVKIFTDSEDVWLSLKNNGIYFFMHLLVIPVEIFIAFLLDSKIKASKFFKSIVFLPYIINGVAVSYMFAMLFSSEGGAINEFLGLFSIDPIRWLSNKNIVNYSLGSVSLWRFSGMHVILFLAAIQSVPGDMLEAAKIDGANIFKQYTKIILPNIHLIVEMVLFLNVRGALQVFDIPFIMTSGGPGHASSTFTLYTIETAFNFNSFGRASAMAIILMFLIIIISKIQKKIVGGES